MQKQLSHNNIHTAVLVIWAKIRKSYQRRTIKVYVVKHFYTCKDVLPDFPYINRREYALPKGYFAFIWAASSYYIYISYCFYWYYI